MANWKLTAVKVPITSRLGMLLSTDYMQPFKFGQESSLQTGGMSGLTDSEFRTVPTTDTSRNLVCLFLKFFPMSCSKFISRSSHNTLVH